MLKCVFLSIRLFATIYIGWPNPAFVIRSFDTARVVQGALELCSLVPKVSRMQSRARSSYAEPQPTLAEHFPNALQRYNIFRTLPNFDPPIDVILTSKMLKFARFFTSRDFMAFEP